MEGKLKKNWFKVGVIGESVTTEDIHDALRSSVNGRFCVSEHDAEKEYEEIKKIRGKFNQKTQHPTVPVQFIYYEDEKRLCYYDHAMGVAGNGDGFVKNCTVEQIGAVLYVRG